jgi:2-polyprenyl-3-methyl-5-hydroxy-6-metoxy-1,4-benzoquinol methylase
MGTPCDLCDGDGFSVIATRDRAGAPLSTGICGTCGLIRHTEMPSAEELEAFYRESYRREYHGEETPSPRRVVRAWRRGQALYRRLKPFANPGGRVFEVGAGLGLNLKPFQLAGVAAAGIEPNESFGGYSRDVLHTDVRQGRLEDVSAEPVHDLVLFAHVIEHMRSPRAALELIGERLLAPDGSIYLECPNVGAPFARPSKLFHRAHIFNFTPSSLRMLAARAGFVVAQDFASERDPTIAVLLRRGEASLAIDRENNARTRRALDVGWLGYHLKPSYLALRAIKLRERAREARETGRVYEEILRHCADRS